MTLINGILVQGLIFSILALGVYITYKILDFPDLSVDGTFPLGAAVTAVLISTGTSPYLTLPLSFLLGAAAGVITGLIHVKLNVRDLLAGVIMMTGLYTINLRIAGKANVSFFTKDTIFTLFNKMLPQEIQPYGVLLLLILIVVVLKLLVDWYLNTKSGYLLRAAGDNKTVVTSLGKDQGLVKILGLSLANGLASLSGCIYAQEQGFFDIGMGTGRVVEGLASVIIGLSVFRYFTQAKSSSAVIVGSVLYKVCVAVAIYVGLSANDLKLVTAVLFLIILIATGNKKKKVNSHA